MFSSLLASAPARVASFQSHFKPSALRTLGSVLAMTALAVGHDLLAQDVPDKSAPIPLRSKAEYLTGGTSMYDEDRAALVRHHQTNRFCADEKLNADEQALDARLHQMMTNQLRGYPTQPFYKKKRMIEESPIFPIIRDMPKGGLLHVHLAALGSMDWILSNALVMTNCYVKWSPVNPGWGALDFFSSEARAAGEGYVRVSAAAGTSPGFVDELRARLTIGEEDFANGEVWKEFGPIFDRLNGFVRNRAVFTNYLYDAFQRLWQDGVYYVEVRDSFAELQEEHGRELPGSIAQDFLAVRSRMQQEHPSFDCRLILTHVRMATGEGIKKKLEEAVQLRKRHPKLLVGFDLIAGEDLPNSSTREKVAALLPWLRELQSMLATNPAAGDEGQYDLLKTVDDRENGNRGFQDLPYYLHDGESAWADNENLFDAVLLRAPRIGHGFNLFRYPTLYPLITSRGIALEICPISNQMLDLTADLRIHPASGYLNAGIQCVLASDDPALFGNDGLSYDFWEALMAWNLDLAALKKLARNSILHSGLRGTEKSELMAFWEQEWAAFIRRQSTHSK